MKLRGQTAVSQPDRIRYGDRMYNLLQIVLHSGDGPHGGHYTSFDIEEMKEFDDSPPSFNLVTDERMTMAKQQGYIYLYQIDPNMDRYIQCFRGGEQ